MASDPQGQFQADELLVRLQGKSASSMARVPTGRSSSALWPAAVRHTSVIHVRPVFAPTGAVRRSAAPSAPDAVEKALQDVFLLELEPGSDVRSLAAELAAHPEVVYAEPNYLYSLHVPLPSVPLVVDDPFVTRNGRDWSEGSWGQPYTDLWGLRSIRALESWAHFDLDGNGRFDPGERRPGEGVVVAVVDTGVDADHPDMLGALSRNPGEIPDNGIDDDANGFVDDVRGWDFIGRDPLPEDRFGHGTHVAATIVARTGDGFGIAGVAPWAQVMPLKGFNDIGNGTVQSITRAVRYAVDNGAHIISNSWGGRFESELMADVFAYARSRGVMIVASVGNSATNAEGVVPAALPGVISVAALTPDHSAAEFTNFGSAVDVIAPGVEVLSASAGGGDNRIAAALPERQVAVEHLRLNGTSMATPHVAGALAVLKSRYPDEGPAALAGRLLAGTTAFEDPDPELKGLLGFGRLDVLGALVASPEPLLEVLEWRIEALQPGARSRVEVGVRNLWESVAGLEASLRISHPQVSVVEGQAFLGTLPAGPEATEVEASFLLEVDAEVEFGTSFRIEVQFRDGAGFEHRVDTVARVSFYADRSTDSGLPLGVEILPGHVDFADYDADGRPDLYYVGSDLALLYRQVGPGRFEIASQEANLFSFGLGVSQGLFFDSDSDGDLDVVMGSWRDEPRTGFFRNLGGGLYADESGVAGIGALRSWTAVALDYDLDGVADFFGGGDPDFGPNAVRRESTFLMRGDGAGGFSEVTDRSCLRDTVPMSNGQALTLDYDGDGDADLATVSNFSGLTLYRNDSDGRFTDVSRDVGLRQSMREQVRCEVQVRLGGASCRGRSGRGLAAGDYDGDGDIDLFVTGSTANGTQATTLFRNKRGRRFVDVTARSGDLAQSVGGTHWGSAFFDFDNDGRLDLYRTDSGSGRGAEYTLYRNRGRGRFEAVNESAFPRYPLGLNPQGAVAAISDHDRDGALDIFAASSLLFGNARSAFLHNIGARENHWLLVRLVGVVSTREALGARVTIESDERLQVREVHTGPVETQPLHFGLGDEDEIDSLTVRWPSGLVQELRDVRADQLLTIEEPVHCLGKRRGKRDCRRVDFEERPDPPRRRHVPRWVRERLDKEFICEREVEDLRIRRRVCGELARECLREAGLKPTRRMLRRGWQKLPKERLECMLPFTSTLGCEDTPRADLLDVCDCFDLPKDETSPPL